MRAQIIATFCILHMSCEIRKEEGCLQISQLLPSSIVEYDNLDFIFFIELIGPLLNMILSEISFLKHYKDCVSNHTVLPSSIFCFMIWVILIS